MRVSRLPTSGSGAENGLPVYLKVISSEFGRNRIVQIEDDVILKQGSSVWPNEEAAIELVQAHGADAPVNTGNHSIFNRNPEGTVTIGMLYINFESEGFSPNYWEYAQMMRHCGEGDDDE